MREEAIQTKKVEHARKKGKTKMQKWLKSCRSNMCFKESSFQTNKIISIYQDENNDWGNSR